VPFNDNPFNDVPLSDVPLSDTPLSDVPFADVTAWSVELVVGAESAKQPARAKGTRQVIDVRFIVTPSRPIAGSL
jgi:hypothetical protein